MTTVAPPTLADHPESGNGSVIERFRYVFLAVIVGVGAVVRASSLSHGTLFPDDAWVAITNHYSVTTASHMLVSAPGFTYFERFWTGLDPRATWFAQLPSLAASIAGIIAIYALIRGFRFPVWVALVCAAILSISAESTGFATHLKPYPFDVLTAAALLWLGERARRDMTTRRLIELGVASVASCAWSFSSIVVVVGVYLVLFAIAMRRRRAAAVFVTSSVVVVGALSALYFGVIHPEITPTLVNYWSPHYLKTGSFHALIHSTRQTIDGVMGTELGFTPHHRHLYFVGNLYEDVLIILVILGAVTTWRRVAFGISGVAVAVIFSLLHKIPLGSNRTDAYLFPGLLLIIAGALAFGDRTLVSHERPRLRSVAAAVIIVAMVAGGIASLASPPRYAGGNLRSVMPLVNQQLREPGTVLLVEGSARWMWAYYEDPGATVIFGPSFNTGYSVRSNRPHVVIVPNTEEEIPVNFVPVFDKLRSAKRLVTLGFNMPGTTDRAKTHDALLRDCWIEVSNHVASHYQVSVYEHSQKGCWTGDPP